MRSTLLRQKLLVRVQHDVQVELLLQKLQSVVAEALDGPHGRDLQNPGQIAPPKNITGCNLAREGAQHTLQSPESVAGVWARARDLARDGAQHTFQSPESEAGVWARARDWHLLLFFPFFMFGGLGG